jgi:hypothetical protein
MAGGAWIVNFNQKVNSYLGKLLEWLDLVTTHARRQGSSATLTMT